MTDIVDRLRVDGASKIEWEAAAEIERLRLALQQVQGQILSLRRSYAADKADQIICAALKEG